jgi:ribA/ribD-fused uncharacterized protein
MEDAGEQTVAWSGGTVRPKRTDKYFWPGHNKLGFLTNEYDSAFKIDGMSFPCVSWYMWYMRAKTWAPRSDLAVLIREAKSKEEAKQLSRRCTSPGSGVETEWKDSRLKLMAKAVLKKFQCSDELGRLLMETGECRLLLASRFDAYHGIGFTMLEGCEREDEWGHNYLGKMLMVVRKRLKDKVAPSRQTTMCAAGVTSSGEEKCSQLVCILCGRTV